MEGHIIIQTVNKQVEYKRNFKLGKNSVEKTPRKMLFRNNMQTITNFLHCFSNSMWHTRLNFRLFWESGCLSSSHVVWGKESRLTKWLEIKSSGILDIKIYECYAA